MAQRHYHYSQDGTLAIGQSSDEMHYNFQTDAAPGSEGFLTFVSWKDPIGGRRKEAEFTVDYCGPLVMQILDGHRAYGMMGTVRLTLPDAPPDNQ